VLVLVFPIDQRLVVYPDKKDKIQKNLKNVNVKWKSKRLKRTVEEKRILAISPRVYKKLEKPLQTGSCQILYLKKAFIK